MQHVELSQSSPCGHGARRTRKRGKRGERADAEHSSSEASTNGRSHGSAATTWHHYGAGGVLLATSPAIVPRIGYLGCDTSRTKFLEKDILKTSMVLALVALRGVTITDAIVSNIAELSESLPVFLAYGSFPPHHVAAATPSDADSSIEAVYSALPEAPPKPDASQRTIHDFWLMNYSAEKAFE